MLSCALRSPRGFAPTTNALICRKCRKISRFSKSILKLKNPSAKLPALWHFIFPITESFKKVLKISAISASHPSSHKSKCSTIFFHFELRFQISAQEAVIDFCHNLLFKILPFLFSKKLISKKQ